MAVTNLVSIRMITDDVARLVGFYERVTDRAADWATPEFAELATSSGALAVGSRATMAAFADGAVRPGENHSVIVEFLVDDVDARFADLRDETGDVVQEPTTMPWGNRSALIRDPDGTLVNLFTPVTDDAVAKYRDRLV